MTAPRGRRFRRPPGEKGVFSSVKKRRRLSPSDLILVTVFLCFIAVSLIQVFFRYVLSNSLSWSEELARILFVWATYLGIAVVSRDKEQITVDILGGVKGRLGVFLHLLSVAATIVILGYFSYLTVQYMSTLVARGMATTVLRIPKYVPVASLLAGSLLSILYLLRMIYRENIRHISAAAEGEEGVDADVEAALSVLHRMEEEKKEGGGPASPERRDDS